MRYGFVKASHGEGTVGVKQNIFTGTVWIFTRPKTGNRLNEPGYGYGKWVKARAAIAKATGA